MNTKNKITKWKIGKSNN